MEAPFEGPASLYAGTYNDGTLKSTDGGTSWTAVLPDISVSALALDPHTPAIVHAGTLRGGVYKSTDAGSTWNAAHMGPTDFPVGALAVDPGRPPRSPPPPRSPKSLRPVRDGSLQIRPPRRGARLKSGSVPPKSAPPSEFSP
jgi:hypothetical protein